ncbi:YtxH domain-containing protein [Flavobacterium sp. ACAM 123]|jgi:gas vesicle protein|uniref:YtxH domain-containing protein n=1 Tax=Flavobacterium sp. ACAM 123 TaxID=1189620 RepID=UPI0002E331D0|nr:YtxH domain-containing protein [Flavobacterium sp. ACAM 123]
MSNNAGNTLIALIGGVAIGAGLGVLFAPAKGDKTRAKIKDGYKEAKADLDYKYQGLSEEMKTKLKSAKFDLDSSYEDLLSNMSDKTEEVISFLEIKLADLKEQNGKFKK